jgi:16S rRNA (cytidine1402-2'-O)-methyltransferase
MNIQMSFEPREGGVLYVVGTPIGNLGDLSERAKEVLREVDRIAAEDTRHTRKLLSHLGIRSPLVSYHEHNRKEKGAELVERLLAGERIALVSDAGMPGISDPGEDLVREAVERGIPVIPVPGPNAALTALVASGLPTHPFLFAGFLPRTSKERKEELSRWSRLPVTLLLYEAPHRLTVMLRDALEVLGDRKAAVCRELTKVHEEWVRGRLSECLAHFTEAGVRGEFTVVIAGAQAGEEEEQEVKAWWSGLDVIGHVEAYLEQGKSKKEAIQLVAKDRQMPKRDVYNRYHQAREESE